MTWPTTGKDGAPFSMCAYISVETAPYLDRPILVVSARRRRWLTEMPSASRLRMQSKARGYILARNSGARIAVEFSADVVGGKIAEPFSPEYMIQALAIRADLTAALPDMVARQGAGGVFVGLPRSASSGRNGGGTGASTRDQSDLIDKVAELLKGDGFGPLECESTPEIRKVPKRAEERHRALAIEALLADIGLQLGRNDVGEDSFREAWEVLSSGELPPKLEYTKAEKARAELELVREFNRQRVIRAFGDIVPRLVLVAPTGQERTTLRMCVDALFGKSVDVLEHALPQKVHGPRSDLDTPKAAARERFTERVGRWRPLAETLAREGAANHVIVQASDWYGTRKDDPVNKLAGRYALASHANANVQYLRPPTLRSRDFANYLHRVQAAVYDLLFGHSGLVTEIGSVLSGGFPNAATRPKAVIGISVVTQSRTRSGAQGGRLCLATRIDAASGETTARVGWYQGAMRWSGSWIPLFEALKSIASPEVNATLGDGREIESISFQSFVKGVVDDAVAAGDRPLVLVDSTSAASLWPSLTDRGISEGLRIGTEQIDVATTWTGARLVRVRSGRAGRLIEAKTRYYERVATDGSVGASGAHERYCPTIVERTVKVVGGPSSKGNHYWMTHGYFQMSFPRGLSVYRPLPAMMPAKKLKVAVPLELDGESILCEREVDISSESYRLPRPIDVTVALLQPEDDADRLAYVIASLRHGYGHTAAPTTLPAPLSFEAKARDYMTRFALDDADLDDDESEDGDPPDDDPEQPTPESEVEVDGVLPDGPSDEAPSLPVITPTGPTQRHVSIVEVSDHPLELSKGERGDIELSAELLDQNRGLWSEFPKAPVLPVPAFVTTDWLENKLSAPNSLLRMIHEWRGEIEELSGFDGWPERKPSYDEFCALLIEGFRYPNFLRALTRAAIRTLPPRKRPDYLLFNPFKNLVNSRLKTLLGYKSAVGVRYNEKSLGLLCSKGHADMAAAVLYLVSLGAGHQPDYLKIAEKDQEHLGEVIPFLRAVEEHMQGDFDWNRDIVHLRASPSAPPKPKPKLVPEKSVTAAHAERPQVAAPLPIEDKISVESPKFEENIVQLRSPEVRWQDAIRRIAENSSRAGEEPNADVLRELRRAFVEARIAQRDWEASRPKFVDGTAIIAAAIRLASDLDLAFSDWRVGDQASRRSPLQLPVDAEALLQAELKRMVALHAHAELLLKSAKDLMKTGDLDRLDEARDRRSEGNSVRAALVSELATYFDRLDLAVTRPQEPTSPLVISVAADQASTPDAPADKPATFIEEVIALEFDQVEETQGAGIDDASLEFIDESTTEDPAPEIFDTLKLKPDTSTTEDNPSVPLDPLIERIERKTISLMEAFEPGLAYHLVRAAGASFPSHEFAFDVDELRLIAMTPYINHTAMQGNQLLAATLERALVAVDHSAPPHEGGRNDLSEEVRQARRLAMFGVVSSLVLFHPSTAAAQILSSLGTISPQLDVSLYPLRDALVEGSRSRLTLTPAMFRAVNVQAAGDRYADECRGDVLAKIEVIGRLQFRFQLGTKIRTALVRGDGALGRLQEAVTANGNQGLAAAKQFGEDYNDRAAIIELLNEAEAATNNRRLQGVDGEARERLVANILELAGLCLTYVQAKDATPAMNVAGQRSLVQNLRSSIIHGLERALPALTSLPEGSPKLVIEAATFAERMLHRLRDALDGKLPQIGPYDHLIAVHGSLPWVSGLRFGSSWLPAPYEADTVVVRLLQAEPVPREPLPGFFEDMVRRCLDEDRYVAAWMLLDQAAFRGIDEGVRENVRLLLHANTQTRKDQLGLDLGEARRSVERVQRLGALVGADDGQDLISFLDRIELANIPAFRDPDARGEMEEQETIQDFAAAQAILDDVVFRVGHLLDKPRGHLLARLASIVTVGKVLPEDAIRVRQLIEKDDLLTAGEYLDFIVDGRGIPASTSPNPKFKEFFPVVPAHLASADVDRSRIRTAIETGTDFGPLLFSRIPAARREDALRMHDEWQELTRRVQASAPDIQSVMAFLGSFLDRAGLRSVLEKIDASMSNTRRKVYAAEMRLRIEQDAEGVLLPEFGSLTGGNYRVVVLARMPTEVELAPLCANAGAQGVILLVTEPVSRDRRRQLAYDSIKAQRKVLVIDEAIVLFALSQAEFRSLTLIECAQPFSFASPYRDYGNQPVPPEIFFGRETEYRKVVEPSGSCIVYGGRRLGKSALLQQVKTKEHAPAAGNAVAYVNILAIGNHAMPSEIWTYASRELPDVFREPVSSASDFRVGATRWLDGDSRRRILVLFDEADRFIKADAEDGFREFIPLQGLMDATGRRFKFVLAGLHNVTRLVHTENPPLKQIASDPQRIGPLMNEELRDAELLVTRPFAALGYEFQNREDVWRILSHCNYYPVLVQTFCKGLLEALTKEVEQTHKALLQITDEHVKRALENERISNEIGEMFDHTLKIDDRYDLIANIMAERSLRDTEEGRVGEGMSPVEVMEAASRAWPAAFTQNHRLSIVEDLLDEMEGLGVLRRGSDEMWSLRSKAILRLLGNETKITSRLMEFIDRPAQLPFEPRTMRRELRLPALFKVANGHSCPLTLGQEHDLLSGEAIPSHAPISLIFGNALSDIGIVAAAMKDFEARTSSSRRAEVVAKSWTSVEALLEEFRTMRSDASRVLFVVDSRSDWNQNWVATLLRSRNVREGKLSVAFVGGPDHALNWISVPKSAFPSSQVKVMPLQLWSTAMMEHHLGRMDVPAAYRNEVQRLTGGFNRTMTQAIGAAVVDRGDRFKNRIERQSEKLLGDRSLLADLGLVGPMRLVFEAIPKWLEDGGITPYYLTEGVLPGIPEASDLTSAKIIDFGSLLGLMTAEPFAPGTNEEIRRYVLNPLLLGALKSIGSAAQAAE